MKYSLPALVTLLGILAAGCNTSKIPAEPRAGDAVVLKNKLGDQVFISKSPESWVEKDLVARVKNGTTATLKEIRKSEITPDYVLIRFKVKTIHPSYTGWVHSFDAGYSTEK